MDSLFIFGSVTNLAVVKIFLKVSELMGRRSLMVQMSWTQEELVLGSIFTLPVAQVACPFSVRQTFSGEINTRLLSSGRAPVHSEV